MVPRCPACHALSQADQARACPFPCAVSRCACQQRHPQPSVAVSAHHKYPDVTIPSQTCSGFAAECWSQTIVSEKGVSEQARRSRTLNSKKLRSSSGPTSELVQRETVKLPFPSCLLPGAGRSNARLRQHRVSLLEMVRAEYPAILVLDLALNGNALRLWWLCAALRLTSLRG